MTAVGSPQQAAEKITADLSLLADKLTTLRGRPDWTPEHDALVASGVEAVAQAATATESDRARRARAADEQRADDLARAKAARSPHRTPARDRQTGGPAGVVKAAKGRARK
ncbi:hypothetical protein [Mycolicibacterium psychrotolerans]|uniref:Uncharacterized protein n=1 Tax=Mycolicibacterium psychrotolerans TaxID=216929 RepID=A0A7I7MAG6_9MYCO|nr:hypothetical protein [Mycolicibacterium psychrotolerans]BBX69010.1 hypothetical protein MPSYJ_24710 [Mycolicibacterium psychrotolerans]